MKRIHLNNPEQKGYAYCGDYYSQHSDTAASVTCKTCLRKAGAVPPKLPSEAQLTSKQFWIVTDLSKTQLIEWDFAKAQAQAENLAFTHRGSRFYVLEAKSHHAVTRLESQFYGPSNTLTMESH